MTTTPQTQPTTLTRLEAQVSDRWLKTGVFQRAQAARADAPAWVFWEGPPTANGQPGVHHVLARTFKDVFARHRTMTGHRVTRKAGFDCHGLPVELEVERQLGFATKADVEAYGVAAFNDRCRDSVLRYSAQWDELSERLGFWLEPEAYRTMDDDYVESVWWALAQVNAKGLLYRSERVVPHCPRCETTLSAHELAQGYQDVTHETATVAFPLQDGTGRLLAWTTTPWTLPANMALAVGEDLTYARVRAGGRVYLLAASRVQTTFGASAEVLETMPGAELVGLPYTPPFPTLTDHEAAYRVQAASFVDDSAGTGVVHVAPAHGTDDFALATRLGLPALTPVGTDGRYDDSLDLLAGREASDAQGDLLADLDARGLLLARRSVTHSYPHCWRCQTELMYLVKSAWYARTTQVAERMRELNRQAAWYPASAGAGRFDEWLAGNVDWALSRERYWGTPLPLWVCEQGHVACVSSRAELQQRTGRPVAGLHREHVDQLTFPCAECGGQMRRTPEVLDVWFDSGCMPFAQHHWPFADADAFSGAQTADFVCEGLDQTRGWFYSLLAVSTLVFDRLPYRNVMCLGLVADENGQKMSKSRGNAVSPWELFDDYGADAVRWYYLTASRPWEGYRFSAKGVRDAAGSLMTLWHVTNFWGTYLTAAGLTVTELPALTAELEMTDLDRWLLSRLDAATEAAGAALAAYDATGAARSLDAFMDELSNWYLRLSRQRFWDGHQTAFAALAHCLRQAARLLAPLAPHLADAVWDQTGMDDSVHLEDYPVADGRWRDERLEQTMGVVRELVELGRTVRARHKLALRQPLAQAWLLAADETERTALVPFVGLVAAELNVRACQLTVVEDTFAQWEVRPHYPALGRRLRGAMREVAAAVQDADPQTLVAQVAEHGHADVQAGGQTYRLSAGELSVRLVPSAGVQMEVAGERAVALNTVVSAELAAEGLTRDVLHECQRLRRDLGLDVSDRVTLAFGGDEPVLSALETHRDTVARELLARRVSFDLAAEDAVRSVTVRGHQLHVSVRPDSGQER